MSLAQAATSTGGPAIAVHGWVAWVIIIGAVAFALGVIWKFVWPITQAAVQFSEIWSQISDEETGFGALVKIVGDLVADMKDLKERTARIEGKVEDILAAGRETGRQP